MNGITREIIPTQQGFSTTMSVTHREMEEKNPEKVKTAGYGEMGRIFRAFQIHQARMYRGFSLVDMPEYNKKLWDDDADNDGDPDSFLGAPSIRSLTDIALNVTVSAVLGPGVGNLILSTALNLADDALFTALDVDSGQQKAGKAWETFGKKTALTAMTTATGSAFEKLDNYSVMTESFKSMKDEIIIDTALAGTENSCQCGFRRSNLQPGRLGQFQYGGLYGTDGPEKQQRRLPEQHVRCSTLYLYRYGIIRLYKKLKDRCG